MTASRMSRVRSLLRPRLTSDVAVEVPTAWRRDQEARPASGSGGRATVWWVAAGISVLVCAFIHWQVGRSATAPRTPWDENHLLQMGRFLAGDTSIPPLSGAGYYPGWSVLIAPIWWVTDDAATVYWAALVLGNVIAVATIWPLALIARRLGVTTPQAITLAAIVMCLPGRTVNADYVLTEKPLMFFLAWTVVAAFWLWRRPSEVRALVFAVSVTVTYFMHARALTVVLTAAVWLVCLSRRHILAAVVGLVTVALGAFAVQSFSGWLHAHVLLSGFGQSENLARALSHATPGLAARILINQVWAQIAGTAGLFAIGLLVLVVWVIRELRSREVGFGGFLFGLTLSTIGTSVLGWSGADTLLATVNPRFDAWVYTRYIDPIATLLALVVLIAMVRALRASVIAAATALAVVLSLLVVFWIAPTVPLWGSLHGPANAAALLPWDQFFLQPPFEVPLVPSFTNEGRFWVYASLFAVVSTAAWMLLRRIPLAMAGAALLTFGVMSWQANPQQERDYPNDIAAAVDEIEQVDPAAVETIDFDLDCVGPALTHAQAINWLPYWLSPHQVQLVDRDAGQSFTSDLVVSCGDWPLAQELGALAFGEGDDYTYRLWVLPGELQDELDERGMLRTFEQVNPAS
ncbi:hypothetical protein [Microbacterium sp. JZ31]|uniref:hypothetical protein n=1 Tax=Microbacterium sp. JZ31 TaxID=1906274 RepID=UPI001931FFDC|nr:hypothetical protein [Microbacterium sp. JZ31]